MELLAGKKSRDIKAHMRSAMLIPAKRKRSCQFSSSKRRRKKDKKSFEKECAAILAASDTGSYYHQ